MTGLGPADQHQLDAAGCCSQPGLPFFPQQVLPCLTLAQDDRSVNKNSHKTVFLKLLMGKKRDFWSGSLGWRETGRVVPFGGLRSVPGVAGGRPLLDLGIGPRLTISRVPDRLSCPGTHIAVGGATHLGRMHPWAPVIPDKLPGNKCCKAA